MQVWLLSRQQQQQQQQRMRVHWMRRNSHASIGAGRILKMKGHSGGSIISAQSAKKIF